MKRLAKLVLLGACLGLMSCAAFNSNPSPSGQTAAGAETASAVTQALMDAGIKGWEGIDVRVENGIVILSGEIVSKEDHEKVLKIARRLAASAKVEDQLKLKTDG